jgi:hypothetical protein
MLGVMVNALQYCLKPPVDCGFCGFDSLGELLAIKLYESGWYSFCHCG